MISEEEFTGITSPYEIQELVDKTDDPEDLKQLHLIVIRGEIGNAE